MKLILERLLAILESLGMTLAKSCEGDPVKAVFVVIVFYFMFSILEAGIEKLIWGERFEHWLDPAFISVFIGFSAYSVYCCAVFNTIKKV